MKILQKLLDKLSYTKRMKALLIIYQDKIDSYKQMSFEEFTMYYTENSIQYSHKKRKLSLLSVALLLSFLSNFWSALFDTVKKMYEINSKDALALLYLGLGILILTLILYLSFVISSIKELDNILKEKIIMDSVKELRSGLKDE